MIIFSRSELIVVFRHFIILIILSLHVCYINCTVFILVLFSKMSKLTLELIELLDGNISKLSDFESESDEEIDELLANFDENENFELPDCPDYGF